MPGSNWKKWSTAVIVLVLAGLVGWTIVNNGMTSASGQKGFHQGDQLASFQLPDTSGSQVQLPADTHSKVTVINFWATWCPPCNQEVPLLDQVNNNQDVTVYAVDIGESPAKVKQFVQAHHLHLSVLLDRKEKLMNQAQITATPTTLFLDQQANVCVRVRGELTQATLKQGIAAARRGCQGL